MPGFESMLLEEYIEMIERRRKKTKSFSCESTSRFNINSIELDNTPSN